MIHAYELRRLEKDDSLTTVLKLNGEPKNVKKKAKEYASRNPGLYTLLKVERVKMYFTEIKIDKSKKE